MSTIGGLLAAGSFAGLLWWAYFDRPSPGLEFAAERRKGVDLGHYVRDVYTWAHAPIVAGIILSAAALEEITLHPEAEVTLSFRMMLAGGLFLFLAGVFTAVWVAFRASANERLSGALAIAAILILGASLPGLSLLAIVVVVMLIVLVAEHRRVELHNAPPAANG